MLQPQPRSRSSKRHALFTWYLMIPPARVFFSTHKKRIATAKPAEASETRGGLTPCYQPSIGSWTAWAVGKAGSALAARILASRLLLLL
ncbi:hypothetical protein WJX74_007430 [Apatococcus lobatus]|uniref:Uncharacterized protein n=1 Tax=Apatococcus lobatus TaxID=904363 RepID=A0AAW1S6L9_9CHLO